MDVFLGGMFSTYGSQVWSISEMDPENRSDPMNLVFPKVCIFFMLFTIKNALDLLWDPPQNFSKQHLITKGTIHFHIGKYTLYTL